MSATLDLAAMTDRATVRAEREERRRKRTERKAARAARREERERKQVAIDHALAGEGVFAPDAQRESRSVREWPECHGCHHTELVHGEREPHTGCMAIGCDCRRFVW